MAQYVIGAQFTIEAQAWDEARAFLAAELAAKLPPGEDSGPWQSYGTTAPFYVLSSIQRIDVDSGVPTRRKE